MYNHDKGWKVFHPCGTCVFQGKAEKWMDHQNFPMQADLVHEIHVEGTCQMSHRLLLSTLPAKQTW